MATGVNVPVKPGMSSSRFGIKAKPKDTKKVVLRLLKELKGNWHRLFLIVFLSLLIAGYTMASPYIIGRAVNRINEGGRADGMVVTIAVLALLEALIRIAQGLLSAPLGQKVVHNLRLKLFGSLSLKSLRYFDTHSSGDLMSRMTNDVDAISVTVGEQLSQLITLTVTMLGVLVIMFLLSARMALLVIVIVPFILLLAKLITKHTRVLFLRQRTVLGDLSGESEESISGYQVVKAFSQEEKMVRSFGESNEALCEVGRKAQGWTGLLMPLSNVLGNLDFILVVIAGAYFCSKGIITVGLISSFALYARQFNRPVNEIASILSQLQSTLAGAERVFEVLDEKGEDLRKGKEKLKGEVKGDISFSHVCFSYTPGREVIKDFTVDIKKGQKVALVGETGSGKTTLVNLLTRMYEIDSGTILLDGVDIKDYSLEELRSCFSVVLQDAELFHLSVYDNLAYGSGTVDKERIRKVAESIGADSFILRLKDGYDTVLEENGMLSSGERQLLTIARAILKDSPLVILDEATSNVDTRTEKKIKKAIDGMTRGRTSFFIAHRLSTIKDSDLIILLDHGEIKEVGNHESLLAQDGLYAEMYRLQAGL